MNQHRHPLQTLPRALLAAASLLLPLTLHAQAAVEACAALPADAQLWLSADRTDRDLTGLGHSGQRSGGAGYGDGRVAQGYALNGVDGSVSTTSLPLGPQWTVEAWVRLTAVQPTAPDLRRLVAGAALNCGDYGIATFGDRFGIPVRPVGGGCGSRDQLFNTGQTVLGSTTVQANTWYHVAATSDGSTARLYLNGVLDGSGPVDPNYVPSDQFRVGREDCCTTFLDGRVDEVTVYSRTLDVSEIAAIAAAGGSGKCLAPLPYLQRSDSPFFAALQDGGMQLEDAEDGQIGLTGVTLNDGTVAGPSSITDSVDGDDGVVDGSGAGGSSLFSCTLPFRASFSAPLPTAVGVVWTDGLGQTDFSAFDGQGNLVASTSANHSDGSFGGGTAEDRFYGARSPGGIGSIVVNTQNNCIELDHLQFGTQAAAVSSFFDTDAEGWTSVNIALVAHVAQPAMSTVVYEPAQGNPPGDIQIGDVLTDTAAAAPAKFLGDKSAYYGGELSFDIKVLAVDGPQNFDNGQPYPAVVLNAGSYSLFRIPSTAPTPGVFTPVVVPLTEAGWLVNGNPQTPATEVAMRVALANLTGLYLLTEYNTGGDDTRIDNVILTPPTALDLSPDPFSFAARSGVASNSLQLSETVTVSGLGGSAPISVGNGSYSINGGPRSTQPGVISNGDRVNLRQRAAAAGLTASTATLTIGRRSASFTVTTAAADATPDAYSFRPRGGVPASSLQTSAPLRIRGLGVPVAVSVTGGLYSLNGAAFTSAAGTLQPNDRVRLRLTASATPGAQAVATLSVGGVQGSFAVTTSTADTRPDAFGFVSQAGVAPSSLRESNLVSIGGITAPAAVSVSGGSYRVNGGAYTTAPGTVSAGQTVQLRQTAAATRGTRSTAVLTVGGVSGAFSVTTAAP